MKITCTAWFTWLMPAWWGHSGPKLPHAGPEYLGNHAGPEYIGNHAGPDWASASS
jgi:hypothetical protein